jgi:hypothetical protein
LNFSSAVSFSIASVEEYWSSQTTAEIQPSFDLKYGFYGAVGRKAATSCREKALVAGISGVVAVAGIIIFGCNAVCKWSFLKWNRPPARRG